MKKIINLKDYKKEKCSICGNEDHICIDVFDSNVCPSCFKEFNHYRNMVDIIANRDTKDKYNKALKKQIGSVAAAAICLVK